MTAGINKTGTNTEAWVGRCTGWMASSTGAVSVVLSSNGMANYVSSAINQLIWGSSFLLFQLAHKTYIVAFVFGAFTGLFSSATMAEVFTNVDKILNGRKEDTNFKASLIFACFLVNKFSPIPTPSLAMFYAAAGGITLGMKASQWIPDDATQSIAQWLDRKLSVPPCPGFNGTSSAPA